VAVAAILLRAALPQSRAALATCLLGFTLLNVYLRGVTGMLGVQAARPHYARNAFVRMTRSLDAIDQTRQGDRVLFWFNSLDVNSNEFDSINSVFLWQYTYIGRSFPAIDPVGNERLKGGSLIAVPSTTVDSGTILEEANRTMRPRGLMVTWRARREIDFEGVHYGITFLDLIQTDLDLIQAENEKILNGDFEEDTQGWNGGDAALSTAEDGNSGKCLVLSRIASAAPFAIQYDALRLDPAARYQLAFYVKAGSSGSDAFRAGIWDNHAINWVAVKAGLATAEWTRYELLFTTASKNRLSVELIKDSPKNGSMLFDSVTLKRLR
jgi:hypothetical protein